MTLSLSDAIEIESFFKVTVGSSGTITTEQLFLLQSGVTDAVNNFIGNRSLPDDLKTSITALFILDKYQNKHGKGPIIREAVKENSWQVNIKSSSVWMDRAVEYLRDFDTNTVAKNISTDPVIRIDSRMDGVIDGSPYRGEIYPGVEDQDSIDNIRVG